MRACCFKFTLVTCLAETFFLTCLANTAPRRGRQQESQLAKSDAAEAYVGKGYQFEIDENYGEAVKEFRAALALTPGLTRVRYQLAVCWFALGNMQEARKEFGLVEKETGGDPAIAYYLARLDLREGKIDAAINRLVHLVNYPPFPDTAYYLGRAYFEKGELAQARKWLVVAAQANPRDSRVPFQMARVYLREGRKAEAEKQFELSAQLRRQLDQGTHQALECSLLLETKPLDVAQPACQRLFNADDPTKLTTLGMIYGRHGLYAEAVQPLERAAHLNPDSFAIQEDLGVTYFRLRRYTDARRALMKAVALHPDFFGSNALLGATLYALGEDQSAYKVLSHAHALNPESRETTDLLFKEAIILARREESQKKYSSALEYLRTAAELQPDNQEVRQWISEFPHRPHRVPRAK
jgi:protein O-GlcNAc transferase